MVMDSSPTLPIALLGSRFAAGLASAGYATFATLLTREREDIYETTSPWALIRPVAAHTRCVSATNIRVA